MASASAAAAAAAADAAAAAATTKNSFPNQFCFDAFVDSLCNNGNTLMEFLLSTALPSRLLLSTASAVLHLFYFTYPPTSLKYKN